MNTDEFGLLYDTVINRSISLHDFGIRYLRPPDAAKYLSIGESTLAKFRCRGDGPPFFRITGRAVGYRVEDLDAWVAGRICHSTKDHLA